MPQPAVAQTTVTKTTLSRALNNSATTLYVASATGITGFSQGQPTTWLFIDKEFLAVYAVSGTTVTVQRAQGGGSAADAHANSSVVWVGPYNAFRQQDPLGGACTSGNLPYLPWIAVPTGNIWNCGNGIWTTAGSFASRSTVGALLTPAATLTFTNPIHHVTTSAVTITTLSTSNLLPATGGCVSLIPDANLTGATTSTGGNIALASTFTANRVITFCLDPGTGKFYPSY